MIKEGPFAAKSPGLKSQIETVFHISDSLSCSFVLGSARSSRERENLGYILEMVSEASEAGEGDTCVGNTESSFLIPGTTRGRGGNISKECGTALEHWATRSGTQHAFLDPCSTFQIFPPSYSGGSLPGIEADACRVPGSTFSP